MSKIATNTKINESIKCAIFIAVAETQLFFLRHVVIPAEDCAILLTAGMGIYQG